MLESQRGSSPSSHASLLGSLLKAVASLDLEAPPSKTFLNFDSVRQQGQECNHLQCFISEWETVLKSERSSVEQCKNQTAEDFGREEAGL